MLIHTRLPFSNYLPLVDDSEVRRRPNNVVSYAAANLTVNRNHEEN